MIGFLTIKSINGKLKSLGKYTVFLISHINQMKRFTKLFLLALCSWFLFFWFSFAQDIRANDENMYTPTKIYTVSDMLLNAFLRWCAIALFSYLISLLIYFIYLKCKKVENPLKNAIKKTWELWLIIFVIVPIYALMLGLLGAFLS